MADILLEFTINAPQKRVFGAFATSEGLDSWWTRASETDTKPDGIYKLYFGPGYDWRARVSVYAPDSEFELLITDADSDWNGTRVGCLLEPLSDKATRVSFHHTGWPSENQHFRGSSYCWAMYLRILKRYLEYGEKVPYEMRDAA